MNKKELIDKQELIDELMKIPGVGSNSDALKTIKRFPSYEPHKPVMPKFVADWFEDNKHALDLAIFTKIRELDGKRYPHETDFENWLDNAENNPIETLIRMKDGYEVEKEPLYEVIIGDLYLIKKFNNRNDFYFDTSRSLCAWEKSAYQLTEAEIKSIDERYWPFAVPVEEVAER